MTRQILVQCASQLAPLYKAAPELLHVVRGCAEYLDRISELKAEVPGHQLVAHAIQKVLVQTQNVYLDVPGDFYHDVTSPDSTSRASRD